MKHLETVQDMINHLRTLGIQRNIILDIDGNTYPLTSKDVLLWDENDPKSPVQFKVLIDEE